MITPTELAGRASRAGWSRIDDGGQAMLKLVEPRKETTVPPQRGGGALFRDPALIEHDDLIRLLDRREAVGDHDDGPIRPQLVERLLNPVLGKAVERVGRFVE